MSCCAKHIQLFLFCLFSLTVFSQSEKKKYAEEIREWDRSRIASLKSATGWVNLAGLFWLKEGENSFGSDASNTILYQEKPFPARLGTFLLSDGKVNWITASGQEVYDGRTLVKELLLFNGGTDGEKSLAFQTFRWNIIKREDLIGVRFRDLDHPHLSRLTAIKRYKPEPRWRIDARIETPLLPTVAIQNVLGQTVQQKNAGKVVFEIEGKTYKLDVVDEGTKNLFVVFGDETNGKDTYHTGRFLYIPRPDAEGRTVIDFNKAYNPPCAFSTHATCPIPPPQNVLPFAVQAGEKDFHF